MPRGYRCIILAALGSLILCGQTPSAKGIPGQAPSPKNQSSESRQAADRQPKPLAVTIEESPEQAQASEHREAERREHDTRDLDAQIRAADAAEKQVMPAWLGAILGSVGSSLIIVTLLFAWQANKIALQTARAVVICDRIELTDSGGEINWVADVYLKNIGASFAHETRFFAEVIHVESVKEWRQAVARPNSVFLPSPAGENVEGLLLAPNDTPSIKYIFDYRDAASFNPAATRFMVLIRYKDVWGRARQTISAFMPDTDWRNAWERLHLIRDNQNSSAT